METARNGERSIYYSGISSDAKIKLHSFKAELHSVLYICFGIRNECNGGMMSPKVCKSESYHNLVCRSIIRTQFQLEWTTSSNPYTFLFLLHCLCPKQTKHEALCISNCRYRLVLQNCVNSHYVSSLLFSYADIVHDNAPEEEDRHRMLRLTLSSLLRSDIHVCPRSAT